MSAELNAHDSISGHVRNATKAHKLSAPEWAKGKKKDNSKTVTPKEASANDVRRALGEGHISPAEASDLNPLGGLTPNSRDVRDAYKEGHISREEAFGLKPTVDINNLGGRSSSGRSSSSSNGSSRSANGQSTKSAKGAKGANNANPNEPIRVRSERTNASADSPAGASRAIGGLKAIAGPKGPSAIGAPGPTASESAAVRAQSAAKGTRNTSSIKVAEQAVDLEDGPNFGKPVYSITDVPRQWNRNA